jgi:hypothetical protein
MESCFVRLAGRGTSVSTRLAAVASLAVAALSPMYAQVVTPKTVPIRQDNQFAIFPSTRAGMADAGIALDDTLADPFGNPAKATSIRTSVVFTSPFAHGVSAGRGGGTTLPIGGFVTGGNWVGGGVLAIQQLNHVGTQGFGNRTTSNQYANAVLARRFANGFSVGGSAYVAALNAVDGVDLLYQGNDRLLQQGSLFDARLGVTKSWARKRFEAEVVHSRTDIDQDVHYTRTVFSPSSPPATTTREDHNIDKTLIWSGHTQYTQAFADSGWRVAVLATGSRLSHPKIPNYQIQNIPRDPGTTWGFNFGLGLARTIGRTTVGIDVVEEPMAADTWGTAERDTAIVGGGIIAAGGRTVSNRFMFANSHVRVGMDHDFASDDPDNKFGVQLGLGAYSINYRLHQTNHVQRTERWQDEGWTEWTPTFGLRWTRKTFTIHYTYRRTCGPGSCVDFAMGDKITIPPASTGGVIAAPSSPLNINGGTAHSHRLLLVVPIR